MHAHALMLSVLQEVKGGLAYLLYRLLSMRPRSFLIGLDFPQKLILTLLTFLNPLEDTMLFDPQLIVALVTISAETYSVAASVPALL